MPGRKDGAYRRVELITGQRRRRRWTAQEKARIVAESFEEGANISEVARRHGVVRGLLTVWRRQVSKAIGVKAGWGEVAVCAGADISLDPTGGWLGISAEIHQPA